LIFFLTILNSRALNGSVAKSLGPGKSVHLSESVAVRRQPFGRSLDKGAPGRFSVLMQHERSGGETNAGPDSSSRVRDSF